MSGYIKKILVEEMLCVCVERGGDGKKSFVAHNKRRKSL